MRKLFIFMMVTLDGYFEGPNHDLSWHNVDEEFSNFANHQLDEADTLLFGRRTYEMMAEFWPSEQAHVTAPGTAVRMNSFKKVVFSRHLTNPSWANTEVSNDLITKVEELKTQEGKSIILTGSSDLGKQMLEADLVDEVRFMVNPLFIKDGSTVFKGLAKNLRLTNSRTFANGNILFRESRNPPHLVPQQGS